MPGLEQKAIRLLDANAKRGKGYYYTAPSKQKYPHQWSWDSSFHAIVNARLGRTDLARNEVLTLLRQVTPDGALPHIIFHDRSLDSLVNRALRFYWPDSSHSPLAQPPVVALAVREIWQQTHDTNFLWDALALLEKHFAWLHSQRRFGSSELVSILSPWESGLDHKPAFDSLLGRWARWPLGRYIVLYTWEWRLSRHHFDRAEIEKRGYFNVREVLFNTVYALGLDALASMFSEGGNASKAATYRRRCADVQQAILDECYDPASGLYFDVDVRTGRQLVDPSISCLMPLALPNVPNEKYDRLIAHLTDPEEFWLRYPVPSVPKNSRHFKPNSRTYLWRGPTWINTNWLILEGLRRHGYDEFAGAIADASKSLVEHSGFREYYNPFSGRGGGERDFGWSTLAAIM